MNKLRVLWVTNVFTKTIAEAFGTSGVNSVGWIDNPMEYMRKDTDLRVCTPSSLVDVTTQKEMNGMTFYYIPRKSKNGFAFESDLTGACKAILSEFKPSIIHIWGTEFPFTWNMVMACKELGLLDNVVISIQGLVSVYSKEEHFFGSVPARIRNRKTLKNVVKRDNSEAFRKMLEKRGDYEILSIRNAKHFIGRTDWDQACVGLLNPNANYHYCSETLRDPFYKEGWTNGGCQKHRVFMSQGGIPYKGLHIALEAVSLLKKEYRDVEFYITGRNLKPDCSLSQKLRLGYYERYLMKLIEKWNLENTVHFLGTLDAEQMRQQYKMANVFILPSAIENSPNSLGEAMLMGTPSVAADVGGVKNLMVHEKEGYIFQHDAAYMLAYYIRRIFEAPPEAIREMSENAKLHAQKLYNPIENHARLLQIYKEIMQE